MKCLPVVIPVRTQVRRAQGTGCEAAGFSLLELLIVFAVMATIAAIAIPSLLSAIASAKGARAVADIRTIGDAVLGYQAQYNAAPNTLNDIGYAGTNDPWGAPYQYLSFATVNGKGQMRKDRFLVPINTFFDLYSMGPDGKSTSPLTAKDSQDDIIWANDGAYIGLAANF
jgi:general secretion pathway protein G